MLRFLADENFKIDIIDGMRRKNASLDIIRVQDIGLRSRDDGTVLAWAAREGRVLLTHDAATIPPLAYGRVAEGKPMPGVLVIPWIAPIGPMIQELLLFAEGSLPNEWENQVVHLPFFA
jgi:hypothetical protein